MEKNLVSIVVPIFNMKDKIEKSVSSLLSQTYQNCEILLVDDGSNDGTYDKCKLLSEKDNRIKVFRINNQGSGPARNFGIDQANGDYIYFPDADDLLDKDAILKLVNTMNSTNSDLIVFGFREVNSSGKILKEKKYRDIVLSGEIVRKNYERHINMHSDLGIQGAPWNKFFKREIIEMYKVRFPALRRHQDEVFISKYVNHAEKITFISDLFYTYYTNDLKNEWRKYPKNYLDIVIELKNWRDKIILNWNPQNTSVKKLIEKEYVCNVIKAFELSFSNKYNFTNENRKEWLLKAIDNSKIIEMNIAEEFNMKYQKIILFLIKNKKFNTFYNLIKFKVKLEKDFQWGIKVIKKML